MEPNYKEALRIVAQALAWHCFGECRSFGEDVPLLKPAEANTYAKFVLDMGAATQQMKGNTMEDYKNYYNKKNVQPPSSICTRRGIGIDFDCGALSARPLE